MVGAAVGVLGAVVAALALLVVLHFKRRTYQTDKRLLLAAVDRELGASAPLYGLATAADGALARKVYLTVARRCLKIWDASWLGTAPMMEAGNHGTGRGVWNPRFSNRRASALLQAMGDLNRQLPAPAGPVEVGALCSAWMHADAHQRRRLIQRLAVLVEALPDATVQKLPTDGFSLRAVGNQTQEAPDGAMPATVIAADHVASGDHTVGPDHVDPSKLV